MLNQIYTMVSGLCFFLSLSLPLCLPDKDYTYTNCFKIIWIWSYVHISIDLINRIYEPVHEISNNVVCATSKGSDQPAHTRSLFRALADHLNQASDWTAFGVSKLKRRLQKLVWVNTCQNATLLEITCRGLYMEYQIDPRIIHLSQNKYTLSWCFQRQMIINI